MAEDENKSPVKEDKDKLEQEDEEEKPVTTETAKTEEVEAEDVKDNISLNEEADDVKEKPQKKKEDEEEEEEEEELPPGLLERPLEIEGKREKKKVERLSASMVPTNTEKKKVEIEDGSGKKLGEIAYIESRVNATKAVELKPLHRILFLRIGTPMEIKKNIRQFRGFTHGKDSKEYEKRMTLLNKLFQADLKLICTVLGLDKKGAKGCLVERIMDFLMEPEDRGVEIQKRVRRRSKTVTDKNKTGTKRKRSPKKTTKKKKPKEDASESPNDADDNDEENESEKEESEEEEQEEEEEEGEEEEEESEEEAPPPPKKKKVVKVKPKQTKTKVKVKKVTKQNGKKEKSPKEKSSKEKSLKEKSSKEKSPKEKSPAKKATKNSSPKKPKVSAPLSDISDSDSDSEDEPIAKMIKLPPSNDEVKELVKKILDGADLETVTMKTVVKQVYSKYPTFDLSDRKDFIKQTVREVIS